MKPILFAAALALTGCATWTHPTKDEAAFHRDHYECEVQAAPMQPPARAGAMQERCMRLKGWTN